MPDAPSAASGLFFIMYRVIIIEMNSPWDDIDEAFEPFYTDAIIIDTQSGKHTLSVVVFNDATSEVINSSMTNTEVQYIQVICKTSDWPYVKLMQIGDKFHVVSTNSEYSVDDVAHDATLGILINARSV